MHCYSGLLVTAATVFIAANADVELSFSGVRGKTDAIRMILSYGAIAFKDTELTPQQLAKMQKEKGQKFTEYLRNNKITVAGIPTATRFAARLAKLDFSTDQAESNQLLKLFNTGYEFFQKVERYLETASAGKPNQANPEYRNGLLANLHVYAPQLELPLRNGTNGLFSPKGLSYVDLFWASLTDWLEQLSHAAMSDVPTSLKHRDQVFQEAKLQDYLKTRKL